MAVQIIEAPVVRVAGRSIDADIPHAECVPTRVIRIRASWTSINVLLVCRSYTALERVALALTVV